MSDVPKQPEDVPVSGDEAQAATKLSPKGIAGIQGESQTVPDWTRQNGTLLHSPYADAVQDEVEDLDRGVVVDSNVPVIVTKPDSSQEQGYIDTLIEQDNKATVIDYKTNDMRGWTQAAAEHFGHEHGQQVYDYVHRAGLPTDTKGYLIAAGRLPADQAAQQTYVDTLALHDVEARFSAGGEPKDVAETARQIAVERGHLQPIDSE